MVIAFDALTYLRDITRLAAAHMVLGASVIPDRRSGSQLQVLVLYLRHDRMAF